MLAEALRRMLCALAGLAVMACAQAQSFPQYSIWTAQLNRLNPAHAANEVSLDAVGTIRRQWAGLEGAPLSQQLTAAMPVYRLRGGVSGSIEHDRVGAQESTRLRMGLSYILIGRDDWALSLGAAGSYWRTELDGFALRTSSGLYEGGSFDHQDLLLQGERYTSSAFGVDAGLDLRLGQGHFGVSVLNALEPVSTWGGVDRVWPRTGLAYAHVAIPIADAIELKPAVLVQSDLSSTQVTLGAMVAYANNLEAGLSLRGYSAPTLDAVIGMLRYRPNAKLSIAYAYDYGISTLQRAHAGSHEFVLGYHFLEPIGKGQLPPVIYNPRL